MRVWGVWEGLGCRPDPLPVSPVSQGGTSERAHAGGDTVTLPKVDDSPGSCGCGSSPLALRPCPPHTPLTCGLGEGA